MESPLLTGPAVVLSLTLGLALAGTLAVLLRQRRAARREAVERDRMRAEMLAELEAAREETRRLAARLETLEGAGDSYLITGVGADEQRAAGRDVPDQLVLSAAFGEPLVKTLAFGHGVRRALSPEVRHRIVFEMRRETRRSRKQRRREMRVAWREARAGGRFDAPAAPRPGEGTA